MQVLYLSEIFEQLWADNSGLQVHRFELRGRHLHVSTHAAFARWSMQTRTQWVGNRRISATADPLLRYKR